MVAECIRRCLLEGTNEYLRHEMAMSIVGDYVTRLVTLETT